MSTKPSKLVPAVWGGIFIVFISIVPGLNFINLMCCSGIMGGGMLSVHLFKKRGGPMSALNGIELGLLAGIIGTALSAIALMLLMPYVPELLKFLDGFIDQRDLDDIFNQIGPEKLTAGFLLIAIGASLIINVVFSTIGGLFGVFLFNTGKTKNFAPAGADDDAIIVEDIDF